MMKNDVLDVLMYIFERFQEQDFVVIEEATRLSDELSEVGFGDHEIDSALDWLDGLVDVRELAETTETTATHTHSLSTRIFSYEECQVLDCEAQGYLYHLEHLGVLDAITREWVIERIMALNIPQVDLEQVKWITMMVLFNLPGKEGACAWFENLDHLIH